MLKVKKVGKEAVDQYLGSTGWTPDTWGNWKKGDYRVATKKNVIRYERKCIDRWTRIASELYSTVSFNAKGMVVGRFVV